MNNRIILKKIGFSDLDKLWELKIKYEGKDEIKLAHVLGYVHHFAVKYKLNDLSTHKCMDEKNVLLTVLFEKKGNFNLFLSELIVGISNPITQRQRIKIRIINGKGEKEVAEIYNFWFNLKSWLLSQLFCILQKFDYL